MRFLKALLLLPLLCGFGACASVAAQVPDGLETELQVAGVPEADSISSGAVATLPAELGQGEQRVQILLKGAQPGSHVVVDTPAIGPILLADPGLGYLVGTFHQDASRTLQLRITDLRAGNDVELYDGLVMLTDRLQESLAFQYLASGDHPRVVRVPVSPPVLSELALDQRVPYLVAFGWGLLSLVYLAVMGGLVLWRRVAVRQGGRGGA